MRRFIVSASYFILGCCPVFGQEASTKFEVASVRLSGEGTSTPSNRVLRGGPGTDDPERFTATNWPLKTLLLQAYGLRNYQFFGPEWLISIRLNIQAKVPPGATEAQFNIMLQNLLLDRFSLTFHRDSKEMPVYEMTVAKSGPRLTEGDLNAPAPPAPEPGARPPMIGVPDKVGFPQIPQGFRIMLGRLQDGIMRWTGNAQPLSIVAELLGNELDRPVVDKTGLTGKYDIKLAYSRYELRQRGPAAGPDATLPDPSGGPSLFKAVQEQLGLNLESKKDSIEVLVIDHIDKVPAEN